LILSICISYIIYHYSDIFSSPSSKLIIRISSFHMKYMHNYYNPCVVFVDLVGKTLGHWVEVKGAWVRYRDMHFPCSNLYVHSHSYKFATKFFYINYQSVGPRRLPEASKAMETRPDLY